MSGDDDADGHAPGADASGKKRKPGTALALRPEEGSGNGAEKAQPRARHDGFTAEKQKTFLETLARTGCISDGCRVAGISTTSVSRWRARVDGFDTQCRAALSMAGANMELLAWDRAVIGEEEIVYGNGKEIGRRRKKDSGLFRMMLIASNPDKYGRMGAVQAKADEKVLRAKIEAEFEAARPRLIEDMKRKHLKSSPEDLLRTLESKLEVLHRRGIAKGWTETPAGHLIPPGYGWTGPGPEPEAAEWEEPEEAEWEEIREAGEEGDARG